MMLNDVLIEPVQSEKASLLREQGKYVFKVQPDANKFQIKGITASSGEETVDEVITKTVRNALDMNLNINMGSFGNIQGNPVLIISL